MMKMYRREEKRERKRGKGTDDIDSFDAGLPFDPREMKFQRYVIPSTAFVNFFFVLFFPPVFLILSCPFSELWLRQQQSDKVLYF